MGGITATTSQTAKTYTGTINSGAKLVASETGGTEILSMTTPKAANYLYFNHGTAFTITLDGTALTLSDAGSGTSPGGQVGPGQGNTNTASVTTVSTTDDDDDDDDPIVINTSNGYFLKGSNILFIFGLIFF